MSKADKKQAAKKILEVSDTASADEIKSAFRKAAMKYHPDRNPGNDKAAEKMMEIKRAYDELTGKSTEPDNSHCYTYSLLHSIVGFLINDMASKGVDTKHEDLIKLIKQMLNNQIAEQQKRERELLVTKKTAQSLLGRWKKGKIKSDLEDMVKQHIDFIDKNLEVVDKEVQLRKDTLKLLSDCTFDFEAVKKQMVTAFNWTTL